jgi:DnaJ-class molecular chaperone
MLTLVIVEITLEQALTGTSVQVQTLDNRVINIPINEIVTPQYQKIIPNEGMPIRNSIEKGNLILKFDVKFPKDLNPQQKESIKRTLSGARY